MHKEFEYGFLCGYENSLEKMLTLPISACLYMVNKTASAISWMPNSNIAGLFSALLFTPVLILLTPLFMAAPLVVLATAVVSQIPACLIGLINGAINTLTRATPKSNEKILGLPEEIQEQITDIFAVNDVSDVSEEKLEAIEEKLKGIHYVINLIGNDYQKRKQHIGRWTIKQSDSSNTLFSQLKNGHRAVRSKDAHDQSLVNDCQELSNNLTHYLSDAKNSNKSLYKSICSGVNLYQAELTDAKLKALNKLENKAGTNVKNNVLKMVAI